jgi:myo-inositol-1-phosphate synthase
MHSEMCGYHVSDIVPVAAFDIDERKVGKDLSTAIFAEPNCTPKISDVPRLDVPVCMGPVMDGYTDHLGKYIRLASRDPVDVTEVLKRARADVVIIMLPTGSEQAARHYAKAAFDAGAGIVNGIPVLLCSDPEYVEMAKKARVPMVGDDFKSQIGGTVLHRVLLETLINRGINVRSTYQINYGGNTDFYNLVHRGASKHASKMRGAKGPLQLDNTDFSVNVSHIELLGDTKICRVEVDGENFAGAPIHLEAKLTVVDSANSSGILVDAVRACKIGLDRRIGGPIESFSSYLMKSPPVQKSDTEARELIDEFLAAGPAS